MADASVSPELIATLETGGLPESDRDTAVSRTGAVGRYQIEPSTAKQYGFDPTKLTDPDYAKSAATAIIGDLSKRFNGARDAVLAAYNAGPGHAQKFVEAGFDPSVLPTETQNYLKKAASIGGNAAPTNIPTPVEKPTISAQPQPAFEDAIAKARAAGYSRDEINQYLSTQRDAAKKAGYSDAEINSYLQPKVAGHDYPMGIGDAVHQYFSSAMGDAFGAAFETAKSDFVKASGQELLDPTTQARIKDQGFWGPVKQEYDQWTAAGKTPVDAFNLAFSGVNGALDAVWIRPITGLLTHFGATEESAQNIANFSLLMVMPEAYEAKLAAWEAAGRAGKPALTAPTYNDLIDARTALGKGEADTGHITQNIAAKWARTGESPASLVNRAKTDPELQKELTAKFDPRPLESTDVNVAARRLDPETFQKYDSLMAQREQYRTQLNDLYAAREKSPAAIEAQNVIDAALHRVNGVEEDLSGAARERIKKAQDTLDKALLSDTPEIVAARNSMHEADSAIKDLMPQLSGTYQKARQMVPAPPPEEETVTAAPKPLEPQPKTNVRYGAQKPVEGTGPIQPRTLSEGVEAKAIENHLTSSFGDLPEYRQLSMKDQAEKASNLIASDYENAKAIAMGTKQPPRGVLPESVFVGVERRAIADGDVDTMRQLATNSKLSTEATTMGQRIRTLGERSPTSPVGAIQDVQNARRAEFERRSDVSYAQATRDTINEIKQTRKETASTPKTWDSFINSIRCD